jgi:hypothetical protein
MSLVRSLLKKNGVAFDDFWAWTEKASKGPHRRLFNSYDLSLRRIEAAHARLEAFVMIHINKPDFDERMVQREQQMHELQSRSLTMLERIFEVYKKSIS